LNATLPSVEYRKLLRLPRSSRAIQLVVNLPESPPAVAPLSPPPTPPKPSGRARVWAIAKVAGPAAASLAALIISLAAYLNQQSANSEQHQVDQAAAILNQEQQAGKVYFFMDTPVPLSSILTVENTSTSPVYELMFLIDFEGPNARRSKLTSQTMTLDLETMPSCAVATINLDTYISQALDELYKTTGPMQIKIVYGSPVMSFQDNHGLFWEETAYGQPRRTTFDQALIPSGLSKQISPHYEAASGCS
jgi:hypothetical protein